MSESQKSLWREWKQPLVIIGALGLLSLVRGCWEAVETAVDYSRLPAAIQKGNAEMLGIVSNNSVRLEAVSTGVTDLRRSTDTNFMALHATVKTIDGRQRRVYEFIYVLTTNNPEFKLPPDLDFDGFEHAP